MKNFLKAVGELCEDVKDIKMKNFLKAAGEICEDIADTYSSRNLLLTRKGKVAPNAEEVIQHKRNSWRLYDNARDMRVPVLHAICDQRNDITFSSLKGEAVAPMNPDLYVPHFKTMIATAERLIAAPEGTKEAYNQRHWSHELLVSVIGLANDIKNVALDPRREPDAQKRSELSVPQALTDAMAPAARMLLALEEKKDFTHIYGLTGIMRFYGAGHKTTEKALDILLDKKQVLRDLNNPGYDFAASIFPFTSAGNATEGKALAVFAECLKEKDMNQRIAEWDVMARECKGNPRIQAVAMRVRTEHMRERDSLDARMEASMIEAVADFCRPTSRAAAARKPDLI